MMEYNIIITRNDGSGINQKALKRNEILSLVEKEVKDLIDGALFTVKIERDDTDG